MTKIKKIDYIYAVGRRKTSSSRVRLYRGKGEITINGKNAEEYFPGLINKNILLKPFKIIDGVDKYYATVKVSGGGTNSQLGAVIHGIARSLAKIDRDNFRPLLKQAGLLTRDPRTRERRKVNTGGKARRAKQSPKR